MVNRGTKHDQTKIQKMTSPLPVHFTHFMQRMVWWMSYF